MASQCDSRLGGVSVAKKTLGFLKPVMTTAEHRTQWRNDMKLYRVHPFLSFFLILISLNISLLSSSYSANPPCLALRPAQAAGLSFESFWRGVFLPFSFS